MRLNFEVWAQLFLSENDCERVRSFLIDHEGIRPKHVMKRLHITVYHARRPMPALRTGSEPVCLILPAEETRFMVMAPGGENPRPELDPAVRKIGIRIQWQSSAMPAIQAFRQHLIAHETSSVLGNRKKSTRRTSAFGARSFQPHMVLLRAGSGDFQSLSMLGKRFRSSVGDLHFDRFVIESVCLTSEPSPSNHTY